MIVNTYYGLKLVPNFVVYWHFLHQYNMYISHFLLWKIAQNIQKKISKQNQFMQSDGYPKTYYQMMKNFKEMLTDKVYSNKYLGNSNK